MGRCPVHLVDVPTLNLDWRFLSFILSMLTKATKVESLHPSMKIQPPDGK